MARVKTLCPAALPVEGVKPSCSGCICRIETTDAGMRGAAAEASYLSEDTNPTTLAAWCRAKYSECPTWREDKDNRLVKPLADQE